MRTRRCRRRSRRERACPGVRHPAVPFRDKPLLTAESGCADGHVPVSDTAGFREAPVSTPDLVRITIDEKDVHVPKGTGLVESALAAGVEIPVFCYEPRLGAAIGACRMCLVEI